MSEKMVPIVGNGWEAYLLSNKTIIGPCPGGFILKQEEKEIILTKKEMIKQIQYTIKKGYITKEDLEL